jgi:hypothetical protein
MTAAVQLPHASASNGHSNVLVDLTGQQFGAWQVVGRAPPLGWRTEACWRVRCACGYVGVVRGSTLRSGSSSACATCARRRRRDVPQAR